MPAAIAALAWAAAGRSLGLPLQIGLTLLLVVPLGPLLYRVAYQPIAHAPVLVLLIVSVALHLALSGIGLLVFGPEADTRIWIVLDGSMLHADLNANGRLDERGEAIPETAPGRHVVQNALAVLGAAALAGADVEAVAASLAGLVAGPGRGKRHVLRHPDGEITLIDESYNANPASMKAAIELLEAAPVPEGGRRIAVLGDMLELGSHSERLHSGLAGLFEGSGTDLVLLAGPHMKSLADALPGDLPTHYRADVDDLKPVLIGEVRAGDVIMIKSSKGIGFSKLVDALISHFPAVAGNDSPGRSAGQETAC